MVDINSPSPVRKGLNAFEIKTYIEMIDERLRELLRHRAEVASGEYHWDSDKSKQEYYHLRKVRTKLRGIVIERATSSVGL
jgi:hypothetical protein|tara:strand:- start:296 stop:538 length:243 start_codon:yes stop_codon:yes gene_type:complete